MELKGLSTERCPVTFFFSGRFGSLCHRPRKANEISLTKQELKNHFGG